MKMDQDRSNTNTVSRVERSRYSTAGVDNSCHQEKHHPIISFTRNPRSFGGSCCLPGGMENLLD